MSSSSLGSRDSVFPAPLSRHISSEPGTVHWPRNRDTYPLNLGGHCAPASIAAPFSPCALGRENEESSSGGWEEAVRFPRFQQNDFPGAAVKESVVRNVAARSSPP